MITDSEPKTPNLRFRKPPKPVPDSCLNCAAPATGPFCAECGQEIKDHSVSLGPLLSDALSEFASWDSKLSRTLIPLLVRPGFLTNQYNAGKRVPYLSPLKLYLTVSVLFFLLLSWQNPVSHVRVVPGRMSLSFTPTSVTVDPKSEKAANSLAEYQAHQNALPPARRDSTFERAVTSGALKAKQSPQSFVSALLGDIPKMMFFLLPLFALSLKLLYWRSKRLYVEHLIFLLHVHAFAFLLLTPLIFLHPDWLRGTLLLVLIAYVLAALRTVYKQSWLATLWKFSLLGIGYITLLSLCLAGTLLVALWLL